MSLYNELINGKGVENFIWEIALSDGNDAECVDRAHNYETALSVKLRYPDVSKITIELFFYPTDDNLDPDYIGDEKNMLKLQENIKEYCISQNIVLSL